MGPHVPHHGYCLHFNPHVHPVHRLLGDRCSVFSLAGVRLEYTKERWKKIPVGEKLGYMEVLQGLFPNKTGENPQPADHQELHLRLPSAWHHGLGSLLQLQHRGHGSQPEIPWDPAVPGHPGWELQDAHPEGLLNVWGYMSREP